MPINKRLKIYRVLYPLAAIYGFVVRVRNLLYDRGWMTTNTFSAPVICVGNLTVGGTGKTPHTEYLIRLLKHSGRVLVVSRGYKRKNKQNLTATVQMTAEDIGDEPWQMKQKFKEVELKVCRRREIAIRESLQDRATAPDVVLLDDAYQYRKVTAGINVLLTNYHRLICFDRMLPAGRLREGLYGKERAQVVIVTKCPPDLSWEECEQVRECLHLRPHQSLFFTTQKYSDLRQVNGQRVIPLSELGGVPEVLLIAGIATPEILLNDFRKWNRRVRLLAYPDHHSFSETDQAEINRAFSTMKAGSLVVTTEKDMARLHLCRHLSEEVRQSLFVLPLEIEFLHQQHTEFNEIINAYVKSHQRNG